MGSKAFTLDNDVLAAIREEELLEFHEKIPTSRALYE